MTETSKPNSPLSISTLASFILMVTMFMVNAGNLYCFDSPQILEDKLITYYDITTIQVSYLYTIYSAPNFIGAPLGGMLLSYIGLASGSIILNWAIFVSSIGCYLAIYFQNYWLLFASRGLFGIGAESLLVAQSAIAEKWFSGRFLSFAIGMNQFFNLFIGSLQGYISPTLFIQYRDLSDPFFGMICVCFIAIFFNGIYSWVDVIQTQKKEESDRIKSKISEEAIESEMRLDDDLLSDQQSLADLSTISESRSFDSPKNKSVFTLIDIKHLDIIFWLLVLVFCLISQIYFQFTNFATDFLQIRFKYKYTEATDLIVAVQVMAAISLPIFSLIVVKIGLKGHILVLASLVATTSFTSFYLLPSKPSIYVEATMVGVTLFFSLYCSVIWTSMALVVPQEATSIALAVATTAQNVLMTILPIVFGSINKDRKIESYNKSMTIFIGMGVCCIIVTVFTTIYDLRRGKVLYESENNKKILNDRQRKSDIWRMSKEIKID